MQIRNTGKMTKIHNNEIACIDFMYWHFLLIAIYQTVHVVVPSTVVPKRGHVIEKHVLIGCKHDILGNQTFEVLQPLSKLSRQGLKVFEFVGMFSINKYGHNFKPGIPLSKDFRNDVIQRYERSIFSRLQFRKMYFSYHV